MIKISHVMTTLHNKITLLCMCITSFIRIQHYIYNEVFIYVLQAKYFYWTCQQFIFFENKWIWCYINKTEANLASTKVLAARCVRVIHAQCVLQFALLSRTLLRSSSNNEPSDPPYRIIFYFSVIDSIHIQWQTTMICWMERFYNKIHIDIYLVIWHNGATQYHT